jgi:hypothetical protein
VAVVAVGFTDRGAVLGTRTAVLWVRESENVENHYSEACKSSSAVETERVTTVTLKGRF